MDKRTSWIAAMLLLLASTAAPAQAPRGPMPALGVPYLIPPGVVALDEQQRQRLASLRRDLHERYCRLAARLIDQQEELRAALAPGQPGGQASARLSEAMDGLRREARSARANAQERAEALLTTEQRTVLARWREGRRGEQGEVGDVPYTVLPGIESDEPDIENLEDPTLDPRY